MTKSSNIKGYRYVKDLLLKEGELYIEDIKALPLFKNKLESETVIETLKREPNVEIINKKYPVGLYLNGKSY